jgi:hydroxymethylbilane synthase
VRGFVQEPLRVGTRGSALAQAQTASIVAALRERYPDLAVETVIVRTSGDHQQRDVRGAFVRELQEALLAGNIDVAVHSLKDLPTSGVDGLMLAAVPPRADARDILVSKGEGFETLAPGARVGTGSVRRSAQLRWHRDDLNFLPLVGNVDTRLRKLQEGDYEAIVLAAAGLQRLGFLDDALDSHILMPDGNTLCIQFFAVEQLLPAPGQGALAVECRENDTEMMELVKPLNHLPSWQAVTAERALLHALGGGCRVPIAAYAEVQEGVLHLTALVATPDGSALLREQLQGEAHQAQALGEELAQVLLRRGAAEILERSNGSSSQQ